MKAKLRYIFVVLLIAFSQCLLAKERAFDDEKIDKLKTLKAFDYDRTIVADESWLNKVLEKMFLSLATTTGQIISISIVVIVLAIVVYLLVKSSGYTPNFQAKSKVSGISIDTPESIQEVDWHKLLSNALSDENYRLAVRYLFLISLKNLDRQKLINWQKNKTNHEYINELKDNEIRVSLQELTRIFEYCWYGEKAIDKALFEHLKPNFDRFNAFGK